MVVLLVGIAMGWFWGRNPAEVPVSSYEECMEAKNSIVSQSYPAVCVTKDGKRFIQPLTDEEKKSLQPPDSTADWKTYKDDLNGFEVNYLETNSDYAKGLMPLKQYLDNDLTVGYHLLLLRNTLKKQYFGMKVQKANVKVSLLDYWKSESEIAKSGIIFSDCTFNQCLGGYKNSQKQSVFRLSNGEVDGRKALFVDNPMPGEYQTTIVLRLSDDYILEIKKSGDTISDQILSMFKFLDNKQYPEQSCRERDGRWIAQYNECESESSLNLTAEWCISKDGEFEGCSSACRHDPDVIAGRSGCADICVIVCKFD